MLIPLAYACVYIAIALWLHTIMMLNIVAMYARIIL